MEKKYSIGNTPASFTQDGNTYYITSGHLGTPRTISDDSGNVLKAIEYDSFGNVISDTNPEMQIPFGFAGGLHDKDTNLIRFGYRDFDPETGRWTARDPIGFAGGDTNLYGYVASDPVNFVDIDGLAPIWVGYAGALIGTLGGAMVAMGNPVGLVLVAVGGGLTIWDMATTPGETAEAVQPTIDKIQNSIDEQQKMLDELYGTSSKNCSN